ncbi:MAG TPA: hypothetical protein DCO77_01550 [Nitrospiraceae bacterium]|nr:hypothetical protein [Nitrospiraceae bacterium]
MKISHSIEIGSTPEIVFSWLEDPDRARAWMTSVTKTEIMRETRGKVGTTFREFVEENGRGTEMRGVVTDFVPKKRLAFYLEGNYNEAEVAFTLEQTREGTRLTQNSVIQFKGVLRVVGIFLGPFLKKKILRQSKNEFLALKNLCEAGPQQRHEDTRVEQESKDLLDTDNGGKDG